MKNSAIMEVFFGKRGTPDSIGIGENERILSRSAIEARAELEKDFTCEQKELFEKLIDAHESMSCEAVNNHYLEGFKLGLLLGIDCMQE